MATFSNWSAIEKAKKVGGGFDYARKEDALLDTVNIAKVNEMANDEGGTQGAMIEGITFTPGGDFVRILNRNSGRIEEISISLVQA